jgi:hypothetical protein
MPVLSVGSGGLGWGGPRGLRQRHGSNVAPPYPSSHPPDAQSDWLVDAAGSVGRNYERSPGARAFQDVQRARIMLYAAGGVPDTQIARRLDTSAGLVGRWRQRFAEHRPDGLHDQPRSGRPRRLPPEQVAEVKAIPCQLPVEHGLPLVASQGLSCTASVSNPTSQRRLRQRSGVGCPRMRSSRRRRSRGGSFVIPSSAGRRIVSSISTPQVRGPPASH